MKRFFEGVGLFILAILGLGAAGGGILGVLGGTIGAVVFVRAVLTVVAGWLTGWFIEWIFGGLITDGLNLILNTTRFSEGHLPMIMATLAIVGFYIKPTAKSNVSVKKEETKKSA